MPTRLKPLQNSTFTLAIIGAILYWAAQPPLDWGLLGWIAPIPWIWLIRCDHLPGRWPYRSLWLAGFGFWMATLHFLRLPHPATSIGWVGLSGYQAFYLPAFVALSRVGVHRCRLSVILVAPVVWTGLELARAHLITGITLGALAYTQYRFPLVIQIASLVGFYGVGFVMMAVAACLGRMLPCREQKATPSEATQTDVSHLVCKSPSSLNTQHPSSRKLALWPLIPCLLLPAVTLGYGYFQLRNHASQTTKDPNKKLVRVGLIQGSIDSTMKSDPEKANQVTWHYVKLTDQALADHKNLDLLVWPETMYRYGFYLSDKNPKIPEDFDLSDAEAKIRITKLVDTGQYNLTQLAQRFGVPTILGLETIDYTSEGPRYYNSSILVRPDAKNKKVAIENRYDKMHRVLFGEYVPFADIFPSLQHLTPLPISITAGKDAQVYEINQVRFSPNICFENILPHVIRRQVNQLQQKNLEPDVLVNLTNDSWFWGSSALDMHLASAVFRAVECRKPMLIAANTGISAWIDANGAIRNQGPRRDTGIVVAEVGHHQGSSPYLDSGDWFAGICLIFTAFLTLFPWGTRLFSKKSANPLATENADG